jgi:hypothetical protein
MTQLGSSKVCQTHVIIQLAFYQSQAEMIKTLFQFFQVEIDLLEL